MVATLGVAQAVPLGQRDGALGQALEDEIPDLAALHERQGRIQAVTGEAGPDADSHAFHAAILRLPAGLTRQCWRCHSLGSSAVRSPSPRKLNARTLITIAIPGT